MALRLSCFGWPASPYYNEGDGLKPTRIVSIQTCGVACAYLVVWKAATSSAWREWYCIGQKRALQMDEEEAFNMSMKPTKAYENQSILMSRPLCNNGQ